MSMEYTWGRNKEEEFVLEEGYYYKCNVIDNNFYLLNMRKLAQIAVKKASASSTS